ncbi:hypothetical protein LZ30DRAFT_595071 [Colletotrichum cereale]|nr:hypothetical protein LZ30DRAFT_595071 [Colletotrichum cereale]
MAFLARKVLTFKQALGPQIIDNRLNPVQLAIGGRDYQIQTGILHIPERYGYFSSDPPRL